MKRVLTVALSGLLAIAVASCGKTEAPASAAPEVYVADVVQKDVPVYMEVVGQTKGSQDVEIRARVEGYLNRVAFTEGSFVRKGELLYQIDPLPLEAALANAKANLATAKARLEKTTTDVNRLTPLAKQQAVSQQELDNALAFQEAARAQVDAQKAAVDKATLDLGYTHIESPIDGLVGTTQVKAGNLVGRGESTLLTTVSQVDPILFRAGISEAEYLKLAKRIQEKGRPARQAEIELLLADGTVHPYKGSIDAVERAVDPTTGTLAVQVKFPNPQRVVRPGQYGRARFVSETKIGALLVPQRAVQELQNLYSVATVTPENKVAFRNVKVGPRVDGMWVIEEGLKPGEKVVVEGLQKVKDGIAVSPKAAAPVPAGKGAAEPAAEAK
ncbi:MAG TPA: efflux RND transporter periplasmic adaptor subunit [Vicinamibacteria bacterium]|nr:efflux RND transporter periplasmic adaptor subunit [Vicinamibacteria bacterium]